MRRSLFLHIKGCISTIAANDRVVDSQLEVVSDKFSKGLCTCIKYEGVINTYRIDWIRKTILDE